MRLTGFIVIVAILVIIFVFLASQPANPKFDFTAVDKFSELREKLINGQEPGDLEWNDFFSCAGYEFVYPAAVEKKMFRNIIETVFIPSKSTELENVMANVEGEERSRWENIIFLRDHWDEVLEELKRIENNPLSREATEIAKKYISFKSKNQPPAVLFIVAGRETQVFDPVVVDVSIATLADQYFHDYLANRYFQYYRLILHKVDFELVRKDDKDLLWLIDRLHGRGQSDLIDKKGILFENRSRLKANLLDLETYHQNHDLSPQTIKAINTAFELIYDHPDDRSKVGHALRLGLKDKMAPTGLYMCEIIEANLGQRRLKDVAVNPFEFVRLYNEAGLKAGDGIPLFSVKTMFILDELERRYLPGETK